MLLRPNICRGIRLNKTPRTPAIGHLKEHAGFLVSRSLTLPAAPPWAAGVIWRFFLYLPKKKNSPTYLKTKSCFTTKSCFPILPDSHSSPRRRWSCYARSFAQWLNREVDTTKRWRTPRICWMLCWRSGKTLLKIMKVCFWVWQTHYFGD